MIKDTPAILFVIGIYTAISLFAWCAGYAMGRRVKSNYTLISTRSDAAKEYLFGMNLISFVIIGCVGAICGVWSAIDLLFSGDTPDDSHMLNLAIWVVFTLSPMTYFCLSGNIDRVKHELFSR